MRPGKKTRPRGGDNSYWTSYSDMMAGMLFVFALILFAAVYQLVDLQQKKTIELQTKEAQLSTQQSLLIDQEAELKDQEELLAATTLALQQQQEELDQNRTALTSAQDSLALQQSKIEEQAALLAAQQAQIDKLVGLRSQIIEDLRDNLSNVGQRVTVIGYYQGGNKITASTYNSQPLQEQLGVTPVYPLKEGMTQKMMQEIIKKTFITAQSHIEELVPLSLQAQYRLLPKKTALRCLHFGQRALRFVCYFRWAWRGFPRCGLWRPSLR